MARVLILAYGNPLRGDDGIGWHAAKALSEEYEPDDVLVVFREQLTPDLAEQVSASGRLIFIDASATNQPGCITCACLQPSAEPPGLFSHEITPVSLLAWSEALYGASPEAVLVSVGAESFEIGETLSPSVAKCLPALIACVRERIAAPEE